MNILDYYDSKFKHSWNASAISRLTPNSSEAKFIYDHLLEVGPKQWLIDAGLSDVFGTVSTSDDKRETKDVIDDNSVHNDDNNTLHPVAKAFYYEDGKFLTENKVRLDDELLADLEFPFSSNIQIV